VTAMTPGPSSATGGDHGVDGGHAPYTRDCRGPGHPDTYQAATATRSSQAVTVGYPDPMRTTLLLIRPR